MRKWFKWFTVRVTDTAGITHDISIEAESFLDAVKKAAEMFPTLAWEVVQ